MAPLQLPPLLLLLVLLHRTLYINFFKNYIYLILFMFELLLHYSCLSYIFSFILVFSIALHGENLSITISWIAPKSSLSTLHPRDSADGCDELLIIMLIGISQMQQSCMYFGVLHVERLNYFYRYSFNSTINENVVRTVCKNTFRQWCGSALIFSGPIVQSRSVYLVIKKSDQDPDLGEPKRLDPDPQNWY